MTMNFLPFLLLLLLLLFALQVVDVNDNRPLIRFDPEVDPQGCCWAVLEDQPRTTRVAMVSVHDDDDNEDDSIKCILSYNELKHEGMKRKAFDLSKLTDSEYVVVVSIDELDREEVHKHHVTITCQDGGSPSLSSSRDVIISIGDVNDNEPRFTSDLFVFNVSESRQPFEALVVMEATDADAGMNGEVRYQIKTKQKSFEIDSLSGVVWSVVKLDREKKSQYNFRVVAEDMGIPKRKSTCQVQINIIDENDETPRFPEPSYQINVQENLAVGAFIGQVEAFDSDMPPYNTIFYELEVISEAFSSVDDPFNMLPFPLDYELEGQMENSIQAYHEIGTNHDGTKIFSDRNNLYSIHYSDEDLQSLRKPDMMKTKAHPFVINSSNGEISLAAHLDRETKAEYRMNVFAKDSHNPEMYDVAIVVVTVVDVNDNAPLIVYPSEYNFTVALNEFYTIEQLLMQVRASDADEGSNSQLKYEIEGVYQPSSNFDPDFHQDLSSTKQLKKNNIYSIANEFWRKHFQFASRSAPVKVPRIVSKGIGRHFYMDQVTGELFGRNIRSLVDLVKSKNSEVSKNNFGAGSIFLKFLIVLSVEDFGDPPLQSHAVVVVIMLDEADAVVYDDNVIDDFPASINETSFVDSNNRKRSEAGWRRWFWIAMGTTFLSLLVFCFLILLFYCFCIKRCSRKRRGEESASNLSEAVTNTGVLSAKDIYGNYTFHEQTGESDSFSSRKLPSLLSKRKQSIITSSTVSDIHHQTDDSSFNHIRSPGYFFPHLDLESEAMDFIDDSESSNSNKELPKTEDESTKTLSYKWLNHRGSLKLASLSLWANDSSKFNDQLDGNKEFIKLKRSKTSADDVEKDQKIEVPSSADKIGFRWNIPSTPSTTDNREDLQEISIGNSYLLTNKSHLGDLKLKTETGRNADSGRTYKKKKSIYQVPSLSGKESNYESGQLSTSGDRIYSNKLLTFGDFHKTFTQESRLSNMLHVRSPPMRRYQNRECSTSNSKAISSDPLKKKTLLGSGQTRNSEFYPQIVKEL